MEQKKARSRFLSICLTIMCMFVLLLHRTQICQANERLLDLEGTYVGPDTLNVGAPIEKEYFDITATIMDTESYEVQFDVPIDSDDLTISPTYMKSDEQEVTVKYRFNGVSKTLTFTIKSPSNEKLISKRELLSISAKYEGDALKVGSVVQRSDVTVTASFRTTYITGKIVTRDYELASSDSWTMSSNVIEQGTNDIIITYNYTDNYGDKPKTYKRTSTITIKSTDLEGDWIHEGNQWRYRYDDDTYLISDWKQTGSNWYYLDEYGYMVTDELREINDATYYFNGKGVMIIGWVKYKGDWYYFDSNGKMKSDGWIWVDGKWYYLKESGVMHTGWKYDNWKWYYLGKDGAMQTGWVLDDVTWYYMDNSGAMMESRWIKSGNKWYFLDIGGAMRVSTWVGNYYVDNTGAWTQTK